MAVPSSGQLRLRGDIALEVDGSATGINVSLRTLSAAAGKSTPDNMSEFYGYSAATPPTISAASASSVTNTSMTLNSNVTSDGGATITERGFYFGTSTNMTSNPKYVVSGTTGAFSLNRTGLSTSSTYRFWAYAKNSQGTVYTSRVDAATYPTMNYSVGTFSPGEMRHYWLNSYEGGTVNFSDTLRHPYLGSISLYSYNADGIVDGYNTYENTRRFAQRSGDWGGTLARTSWNDNATINYPWWQNKPAGTEFVFQLKYDAYAIGTGYGWAAQGSSSYGYGGYGCSYKYTGTNYGTLYTVTGGGTAVWSTYINAEVYK